MVDHPVFTPDQSECILDFFHTEGYAVVSDALQADEITFLNGFVDRSQGQIPGEWGPDRRGCFSHGQILVNHAELDPYLQYRTTFPLIDAIMSPGARFAQFDFRDIPAGKGDIGMNFHKDGLNYQPEQAPEKGLYGSKYLCAIYHLSDVDPTTPRFCVVPRSGPHATVEEAREKMGAEYCEVPILGPAGTVVLYGIELLHTRLPGLRGRGRRTQHNYFSREGNPPLTSWVLIPERLGNHADSEIRTYFSTWPEATQAFAASGYTREFYDEHVLSKPT